MNRISQFALASGLMTGAFMFCMFLLAVYAPWQWSLYWLGLATLAFIFGLVVLDATVDEVARQDLKKTLYG